MVHKYQLPTWPLNLSVVESSLISLQLNHSLKMFHVTTSNKCFKSCTTYTLMALLIVISNQKILCLMMISILELLTLDLLLQSRVRMVQVSLELLLVHNLIWLLKFYLKNHIKVMLLIFLHQVLFSLLCTLDILHLHLLILKIPTIN